MSTANTDVLEELGELIEDLTTTGQPSLNEKQLKRLKAICKTSNSYVNHAFHLVMTQLKKYHAEIRLSSFQIISELFTRSHVFRELLLSEFQVFLELVVASDAKKPLPPPSCTSKILKTKAVDVIESWYQSYGNHYKKLELGYQYLRRLKHVEFDAVRNRTLVERRQAQDREERKQRILQKKIDKVESEIAEQLGHIELCTTEMNNCFKLLLPHPDDYGLYGLETTECCNSEDAPTEKKKQSATVINKNCELSIASITSSANAKDIKENNPKDKDEKNKSDIAVGNKDNDNVDNTTTDELKDHGLGSRSYEINININELQPSVNETNDNAIVVETTRELNKEITHKYLPMVNQWLKIFTKAGYNQQRIQSVIDLKRQLVLAKEKFFELNISPIKMKNINDESDDDDDDDDQMVDVPEKEGIEYIPPEKSSEYGLEPLNSMNKEVSKTTSQTDEAFLSQHGFTLKDAEDPTSHARALLEARKKYGDIANSSQPPSSTGVSTPVAASLSSHEDDTKRRKLLEKAPVIKFDMDLYHWDDPNYEPPKIIRSHNFNNFWASKDAETEHTFEEAKGTMVKRNISFGGKFEPVKWSCRALLPSGKLCPRKDRYKCPFHGVIIARDDRGRPTGESSSSTSTSSAPSTSKIETWQDIQHDIEAATGVDLNPKGKKRKARKAENPDKKLSRKEKYSRLTDINKSSKSAQSRLEKKVLDKKSLKRVAAEMDNLVTKKVLDKFGDQFNYQYLIP